MKDYFDLWILACHTGFVGETLYQAIEATFSRRKTDLAIEPPLGLTMVFAQDPQKQVQWKAFLRKNALEALPLKETVEYLADFLMPVATAASKGTSFTLFWNAGGPWVVDAGPN